MVFFILLGAALDYSYFTMPYIYSLHRTASKLINLNIASLAIVLLALNGLAGVISCYYIVQICSITKLG